MKIDNRRVLIHRTDPTAVDRALQPRLATRAAAGRGVRAPCDVAAGTLRLHTLR